MDTLRTSLHPYWSLTNSYRQRIAHGMLTVSISTGLSQTLGIFEGTTIALMQQSFTYKAPVSMYWGSRSCRSRRTLLSWLIPDQSPAGSGDSAHRYTAVSRTPAHRPTHPRFDFRTYWILVNLLHFDLLWIAGYTIFTVNHIYLSINVSINRPS